MNHPIIKNALARFRQLLFDEFQKELVTMPNFGMQFDKGEVRLPCGSAIASIRWDKGKILLAFEDCPDEENDICLFSVDELLVVAEKIFPESIDK